MENSGFKSDSDHDSTSHESYASSTDVVVAIPESKKRTSRRVSRPSETLPSTSEITLKTAYRTTSSDVNKDSGSGTDSHDEYMAIPEKLPVYTVQPQLPEQTIQPTIHEETIITEVPGEPQQSEVSEDTNAQQNITTSTLPSNVPKDIIQPYAVSHVIEINQSAIESAYHNPYISLHSDDVTTHRSGADGDAYEEVQAPETVCPSSPKSELSRSHSAKSKVSSPGVYTRQLNMFIGEEWENVQQRWTTERKALSCPGTLRVPAIPTSETYKHSPDKLRRLEILQRRQQQATHDPLRYFFYQMTREERESPVPKDHVIKPNPYNNVNHKIHSALHCPCFFFFYLLCCLPGVHYMQKGDLEYKSEHDELARKYSRLATIFYLIGAVIGTLLLATTVYFAVNFVQTQVK